MHSAYYQQFYLGFDSASRAIGGKPNLAGLVARARQTGGRESQ